MYLLERKEATYENLRDLNFEYKAGKLSEQDYAVQRASLEDEAAAILAEMESIEKARAVVRHGTRRPGGANEGGREEVGLRGVVVGLDRQRRRRNKPKLRTSLPISIVIPSEDFRPSRGTGFFCRPYGAQVNSSLYPALRAGLN